MVSILYKTHYEVRIPYKNACKLIEYLNETKVNYDFLKKLDTKDLYKIINTCPIGLQWGVDWTNVYQCFVCPKNYDFVLKGTSEFYTDDVTTFLSEISMFCRDFIMVEYCEYFEEEEITRCLYENKNGIFKYVERADKVLSYSNDSDDSDDDSDDESKVDSEDEEDESDFFNFEKYIYCKEENSREEIDFEELTNLYGFSKDKVFNNDENSWDGYKGSFYPDGTPVKFIDQMNDEEREEHRKKTFPLTYKNL
jgi:hypothetical protein